MKTLLTFLTRLSLVVFLSICAEAIPSARTAKTEVTGTIVDYDRRSCVLMLKDFKGWDRKQTEYAPLVARSKTVKWLKSFDATHAAIFIKKDDIGKIKKGADVKIEGYSYFTDEWSIYAEYDKLTVTK